MLEQHIRESNAIEGLPNEGLYLSNSLLAARLVVIAAHEGQVLHPRVLHAVVMEGLALPGDHMPGEYRRCRVRVGAFEPPPPDAIGLPLNAWWDDMLGVAAWDSHAEFERIHPFPDGNGRVGRLVYWNEQLVRDEAPELIHAAERHAYYARLEVYRASVGRHRK